MDTQNNSLVVSPPFLYLMTAIAFLLGGIIGAYADPYLPASLSNTQKGYQSGFTAAKTLVEKSSLGAFFTATPNDIRTVSGTVTAVNGDKISLHSASVENPFDSVSINDRVVRVGSETKVIRLVPKDIKTAEAEMDAFRKALQKSGTTTASSFNAPPYNQMMVTASDIKLGDIVIVTADTNIKNLVEFTAQKIQIEPKV